MNREHYAAQVNSKGMFEGEPIYSPYFWYKVMDGLGKYDGNGWEFTVTEEDKALFPELDNGGKIRIWQNDEGFVFCDLGE